MTRLLSLSAVTRMGILLALLLFVCGAAWAQADTSHEDDLADSAQSLPMQAPPPVNAGSYPTTFTSETESNYLRFGLTTTGSYSNNITLSEPAISGGSFSVGPTIKYDKTTVRTHYALSYSPGFTIYRISALNQTSQNVSFALQYRLSPNVTASVNESFNQTSNIFNQPNPLSVVSVSGSAPSPQQAVIPPSTNQITNGTNAQITYQCGENCLIGAGGVYSSLLFTDPPQLTNLYNLRSGTGSTFYARRIRDKYYLGASYQFQGLFSYPAGAVNAPGIHSQTQLFFGFFTAYLTPAFSVSLSAGPQHVTVTEAFLPTTRSWSPMAMVSLGWQGNRTSLAGSYSRTINSAGGLNGIFQSNIAGISGRWQMNRIWTLALSASYATYQDLLPAVFSSATRGHSFLGTVAAQRPLGEHLSVQAGYNRIQQDYQGTAYSFPTMNRAFVSLTYQFARPF